MADHAYDIEQAMRELSGRDRRLARLIERVGPCPIGIARPVRPFDSLLRAIVYQQLSGRAAATIHGRLCALFPRRRPRPESLLALGDDVLRGAGVSRPKIAALRDLSARVLDRTVPDGRRLRTMDDDAIVERLVQIRGIGRWTVEMMLIFDLARPDVLPVDDLGVRKGCRYLHRLAELPPPARVAELGERWRPWRSVASWYLWRASELGPQPVRGRMRQ